MEGGAGESGGTVLGWVYTNTNRLYHFKAKIHRPMTSKQIKDRRQRHCKIVPEGNVEALSWVGLPPNQPSLPAHQQPPSSMALNASQCSPWGL